MRPFILTIAILAATALPAAAQEDDARFTVERVGDNFIRLDQASGEVRLCVEGEAGFTCRTVVEPAAAPITSELPAQSEVLAENERLKAEIRDLRERLSMIAALVEDVEADAGEAGTSATSGEVGIPSIARREIDNAVEVTGYALRRFRDLIKSLTEEENTAQ